jgi:hypothetical protein
MADPNQGYDQSKFLPKLIPLLDYGYDQSQNP